ncbi:MAG: TIGR01777 family oxidoreductase [Candidatus Promineifilaceae bacterium]
MHVILAGGTGLIGQAVAQNLIADGHQVTVLSRSPERQQGRMAAGVALRQWDGRTAEGWADVVETAAAIMNLAGENLAGYNYLPERWTDEKRQAIRSSRLNAGNAVVEAIYGAKNKPAAVIQASAVGYYGYGGDRVLTESAVPGDDWLASVAVDWEAATAEVEKLGVRRVIMRTGLLLTPEGGPLQRMLPPFKLFVGGPFGSGNQWWPWIHLMDEVRAIRFLLENEAASGPYNLTAPMPVRNRDFARALGRALGRPALIPVPGFAMKLLFGEVANLVLDGQRAIPQRLEQAGFAFRFHDPEQALRDLLGRT